MMSVLALNLVKFMAKGGTQAGNKKPASLFGYELTGSNFTNQLKQVD